MLSLIKNLEIVWSAIVGYIKDLKELNMKMKVTMSILLATSLAFMICSGCVTPNEMYINSNYKYGTVAIPLLKAYTEKDASLLEVDKKVRIKSLEVWLEQINQAKQELEDLKK